MATVMKYSEDVSLYQSNETALVELKRSWAWILALGIATMVLGALAILSPFVATLATQVFIGSVLILHGIAEIVHAFKSRGRGGSVSLFVGGVLSLAAGLLLLAYPFAGALSLTLFAAIFLVLFGIQRCFTAYELRALKGSGWMGFNGILSVLLGGLVFAEWPGSGLWVIGLYVGINVLMSGLTMCQLALLLRRTPTTLRPV